MQIPLFKDSMNELIKKYMRIQHYKAIIVLGPRSFIEYGIAVISLAKELVTHLQQNSDTLVMLFNYTFMPIFDTKVPRISQQRCQKFHRKLHSKKSVVKLATAFAWKLKTILQQKF